MRGPEEKKKKKKKKKQQQKLFYGGSKLAFVLVGIALVVLLHITSDKTILGTLHKNQLNQKVDISTDAEKSTLKNEKISANHKSVCSAFRSLSSTSPMAIWRDHLNKDKENDHMSIKWASQHLEFEKFHDFIFRLMYYITPQRLEMSIKTIPFKQQEKVGKILKLAFERYTYVQKTKSGEEFPIDYKIPRKVRILTIGGSVTMGIMCHIFNPVGSPRFNQRACSWSSRLTTFLEYLFPDVFEGHMFALGGTNTKVGLELWQYNLLPDHIPHPDILINAYSTNDMHVISINESNERKLTIAEYVFQMYEEFVREVLQPRISCNQNSPPLLFILDDYIGNEQREIHKTRAVNHALNELSTYYGFGFISYADVVRDFAYGDTSEMWFSPSGWPKRQIHPGMGAHISIMWVVAYNLLNTAAVHCDSLNIDGLEHMYNQTSHGMEKLNSNKTLGGEPKPRPRSALPPKYTSSSLNHISYEWQSAEMDILNLNFNPSQCSDPTGSDVNVISCPFSWTYYLFKENKGSILKTLHSYINTNDGWYQIEEGKIGLVPNKIDAKLNMEFNVTSSMKVLNFMFMKSYGEKWAESKIKVDAFVIRNGQEGEHQEAEIEGFHMKNTSEVYTTKVKLDDKGALKGNKLHVNIQLVGGSTFKLMGMMFCAF